MAVLPSIIISSPYRSAGSSDLLDIVVCSLHSTRFPTYGLLGIAETCDESYSAYILFRFCGVRTVSICIDFTTTWRLYFFMLSANTISQTEGVLQIYTCAHLSYHRESRFEEVVFLNAV